MTESCGGDLDRFFRKCWGKNVGYASVIVVPWMALSRGYASVIVVPWMTLSRGYAQARAVMRAWARMSTGVWGYAHKLVEFDARGTECNVARGSRREGRRGDARAREIAAEGARWQAAARARPLGGVTRGACYPRVTLTRGSPSAARAASAGPRARLRWAARGPACPSPPSDPHSGGNLATAMCHVAPAMAATWHFS